MCVIKLGTIDQPTPRKSHIFELGFAVMNRLPTAFGYNVPFFVPIAFDRGHAPVFLHAY